MQGVGFRPAVYRTAVELGLKGEVFNDGQGVVVIVEGKREGEFKERFLSNLPPLAEVTKVDEVPLPPQNYQQFKISPSQTEGGGVPLIPPDLDLCPDCQRELEDPSNRRYLYPFISCTNCGPRWTIITALPYDRVRTTMERFPLCPDCRREYTDPTDRRFHAEPISCYRCGPTLSLWIKEEGEWKEFTPSSRLVEELKRQFSPRSDEVELEPLTLIAETAERIKRGEVVAVKGVGGFHLICDATNRQAVEKVRLIKERPYKPLALLCRSLEGVKEVGVPTPEEERWLLSQIKPIVLVRKKVELPGVADQLDRFGLFLPYTPLHHLLFKFLERPLIATSANRSGLPLAVTAEEVMEQLGRGVTAILDHNRPIANRCDDSLIQIVDRHPVIVRAGRGLTPHFLPLSHSVPVVGLGVGANQKNRIAFLIEDKIVSSPHIGDLENLESLTQFERVIERFRSLYGVKEEVIVADKHPRYLSTRWAVRQEGVRLLQLQHHYAHLLAVMAEHKLEEGEFLGVAFDGTGYGDDGTIWGGEVMVVTPHSYRRLHHLRPFKLIGGEKGVKKPELTALSLLPPELGTQFPNYPLAQKLKTGPFPLTSSMGRLFDMVGWLGGLIDFNRYEGFSGMVMERFYRPSSDYIPLSTEYKEVDFSPLLEMAVRFRGEPEKVSTLFLNSIAQWVIELAKRYQLPLLLGGGVFQNRILLSLILESSPVLVYFNSRLPANDGSIAVGQLYYLYLNWEANSERLIGP